MESRGTARIGAICAFAGSMLLVLGTFLHPLGADPNDAVAAFAEYAADRLWIVSHLLQLAGVALLAAALLCLADQLQRGSGSWTRLAAGGAIASLAVAAVLMEWRFW